MEQAITTPGIWVAGYGQSSAAPVNEISDGPSRLLGLLKQLERHSLNDCLSNVADNEAPIDSVPIFLLRAVLAKKLCCSELFNHDLFASHKNRTRSPLPLPFAFHCRHVQDCLDYLECKKQFDSVEQRNAHRRSAAVGAWHMLLTIGLNNMYGAYSIEDLLSLKVNVVQKHLQVRLLNQSTRFVGKFETTDRVDKGPWPNFFANSSSTYSGGESSKAQRLDYEEILAGLPPIEFTAKVMAHELADQSLREALLQPENFILPENEWPESCRQGAVLADKHEWIALAQELLRRGILRTVPDGDVPRAKNGDPIVGGVFGVVKKGSVPSHVKQILRLIFNLRNNNQLQRMILGDIFKLPVGNTFAHESLSPDEGITGDGEDIKSCFYIFGLPEAWSKWLCVGPKIFLTCEDGKCRETFVGAAVIPMGWLSAVGVVQSLHRRIIKGCIDLRRHGDGSKSLQLVDPQVELTRAEPFPLQYSWFPRWYWSVYVDDWQRVQRHALSDICDAEGVPSKEQKMVRANYASCDVPAADDKSFSGRSVFESKGSIVDGVAGTVDPTAKKLLNILPQTCWVVLQSRVPVQWLQQTLGRWNHLCEHERHTSSTFDHIYHLVAHAQSRVVMDDQARNEFLNMMMLLPCFYINMRKLIHPWVFAVDASLTGAGVMYGDRISKIGRMVASRAWIERSIANPPGIILVECFGGYGGARLAADLLGVNVLLNVVIEINKDVASLSLKRHDGVVYFKDIREITYDIVVGFRKLAPSATCVVNVGGSPCQDLSLLNALGAGLDGTKSSLFWDYLHLLEIMVVAFQGLDYIDLLENVSSMDVHWIGVMNAATGRRAISMGPDKMSRVRRSRLFFCNFPVLELLRGCPWALISPDEHFDLIELDTIPVDFEWTLKGTIEFLGGEAEVLPTMTRSIPRYRPPLQPAGLNKLNGVEVARWKADFFRFPPYSYQTCFAFKNDLGNIVSAPAFLREFVHFVPRDFTAPIHGKVEGRAVDPQTKFDFQACCIGNGFHVGVAALLMGCGLYHYKHIDSIPSPAEVAMRFLQKEGRGEDEIFLEKLRYFDGCSDSYAGIAMFFEKRFRGEVCLQEQPPCADLTTGSEDPIAAETIARTMIAKSTVRGTDIRVDTGQPFLTRGYPRSAVNIKKWKFRLFMSFKWSHVQHINALETHVIRSLLERLLRSQMCWDKKFIVCSDSQVAISILSKCRTASRRIKRACGRINALCLLAGFVPCYIYVRTKENPADKPSRQLMRTGIRWLQGKRHRSGTAKWANRGVRNRGKNLAASK